MSEIGEYVLGLDIGTQSVGWAILPANRKGNTGNAIVPTGARIFEAAVTGDIEHGREVSNAVQRRDARLSRRGTERRARRLNLIYSILQNAGLLPPLEGPGDESTKKHRAEKSQLRHETLLALDKQLAKKWTEKLESEGADKEKLRQSNHTIPYILRARALDEKLEPYEIGRALYHLAQRRGFKSNRKSSPKKDEELGKVKGGISELQKKIDESGSRTLGEYFSKLDPEEERIRQRWTGREMYEDEFEKIWAAQQPHHPKILTENLKKQLIGRKRYPAIFYQRPLKIQKHLVGDCELEKGRKRAPWTLLLTQRFRMLQMVGNTRVITPFGEEREFTPEERTKLIEALETEEGITFAKAKKLLNIKDHHFNWEEGAEKRFLGNKTAARLAEIFGKEKWLKMSEDERNQIIEDVRSIQKDETLKKRGVNRWGLDEEAAKKLSELQLEQGYCRLSRQAIEKLLPLMEKGVPVKTAEKEIYGEQLDENPLDFLPPVDTALTELRNPTVHRALTELRKVVNAVIREHGKPALIRIELARDLRRSASQRRELTKRIDANEKARKGAAQKIIDECKPYLRFEKAEDVSKHLILQWRLADECNWQCPYTGKPISVSSLFSDNPEFEIEHIFPFSRSLDNSFLNKTLCDISENRNVKRNSTPFEAYGRDEQRWNEIIHRIKKFKGNAARIKLQRFQTREARFDDFASQQLNDTRYASKLAKKYLGLLYGSEARSKIQAGRGGTTAFIRDELALNSILGDGDEKSRTDHRHHAVDAVAIALTSPAMMRDLSDAAVRALKEHRRRFGRIPQPWNGFWEDIRRSIENITVSHRVSKKISGALHEESLYSIQKDENGRDCIHIRKPVESITKTNLKDIVDPVVRASVGQWLAYEKEERKTYPTLKTKDGREIPIKKVRIRKYDAPMTVGDGNRARNVLSGSNHHLDIFEVTGKKGNPKWEGRLVSTYNAMRLKAGKKPVYSREREEGGKFLFSLSPGEIIEFDEKDGSRALYRVRTISQGQSAQPCIEFVALNDARKKVDIKATKDWKKKLPEPLRKLNCRKVVIDPIGTVRRAND